MLDEEHRSIDRANEKFPVLAYEPETRLFYLEDQTLAFAFMCQPLTSGDDKAFNRINVLLNENWPKDSFVQFVLYGAPDIGDYVSGMLGLREGQSDPLLMETILKRAKFMTEGTRKPLYGGSAMRVRDIRLMVVVKCPIPNPEPTPHQKAEMTRLRVIVETALTNIGFQPEAMTKDDYVHEMSVLLNHAPHASWRRRRQEADPDELLQDQILDFDSAIKVHSKGLQVGDTHVRLLSVKKFPQRVAFGTALTYLGDAIQGIRGIYGPFVMSATLYFPDPTNLKDRLGTKKQMAISQKLGPLYARVPKLKEKADDLENLFNAFEDGHRPVKLFLALILFADSEAGADAAVSNAMNYWGECGFTILPDRFYCLPLFLNAMPFGPDRAALRDIYRYKTMSTAHVIPLLPVFADWKGTGTPMVNLLSRNGQIMNVSLFDSSANYNCCIVAQSGSGKSFLTNEFISSEMSAGGQVWVIDCGRSYEKQCAFYGGDFIHFGPDTDICLNPFEIVQDYEEEADALVGLLVAMAAPNEPLTNLQLAELKRTVGELWDELKHTLIIDNVAEKLKQHEDQRVKDIGVQLYSFTSKGEYGKYFNGRNNVKFDNRFTVLELDDLRGRKHLQQVVLLQLILQIQNTMYLGARNRHKMVIIDEAWALLAEGNEVAPFIEASFRKFRKYNGSAVVVTQGLDELYASDSGRAIVANSTNMFLLSQKIDVINQAEKENRLPIGPGGYHYLKTVHTVKGKYSEMLCITDYGLGIGRLIVDPFRYYLYSTHPDDVQAVWRKQRQGRDVRQAIEEIIAEKGLVDVAA
ncbi:type IV secretion system protein TraC [Azospirillum sp. sgz302134]